MSSLKGPHPLSLEDEPRAKIDIHPLSAPGGGEGWGEVGDSSALTVDRGRPVGP